MEKDYCTFTALHYSAFRPALHNQILSNCLDTSNDYDKGLDVGCGTGQSAIALSEYCEKVVGIEPSTAMLARAIPHPAVSYQEFDGVEMRFGRAEFDVITFAGSWFYAKSQILLDELDRIGKSGSTIIIYDFEVAQGGVLNQLGVTSHLLGTMEYDHHADFSGLDHSVFEQVIKADDNIAISLNPEELAHLILAQKNQHKALSSVLGAAAVYEKTVAQLHKLSDESGIQLPTHVYYTVYKSMKR